MSAHAQTTASVALVAISLAIEGWMVCLGEAIGQDMAIVGVSSSSSSHRLGLCLPPASAVGPVSPRPLVAGPLVLWLLRLFGLLGPLQNERL